MRTKSFLLAILLIGLCIFPVEAAVTFTDTQNHWAATTIQWGIDQEVTKGYPDGTFKPNNTVTEAQFLAMLERAFTKTTDGNPWYQPYYDLAKTNNYPVTSGTDNLILRTQVAEIVAGSQGVNYTGDNAIQYLLGKGIAKGTVANDITIVNYQGGKTLARGEAVQFIKNLKDAGIKEIKARPIEASLVSDLPALPAAANTEVVKWTDKRGNNFSTAIHANCTLPLVLGQTTVLSVEKVAMYNTEFVKVTQTKPVYVSFYLDTIADDIQFGPDGWASGTVDGYNFINKDGTYSYYCEITKYWAPTKAEHLIFAVSANEVYEINNPINESKGGATL